MDNELFLLSAGISGVIGSLSPFILPQVFKLIGKIFEKDLSKEEKRLVITVLSAVIGLVLIIVRFQWNGDLVRDLSNFAQFFFINFVAIKGMVQVIYELVVKSIPALEERFS